MNIKTFTNRALFLDRDGVVNEDYGHVHKIKDFKIKYELFEILNIARDFNYKIIIITNQGGIGRGLYTELEYHKLTNHLKAKFLEQNITIDDIYYCPFHPYEGKGRYKKDSFYRKPKPGMIKHAINKYKIDIEKSMMIGNSDTDKIASIRSGIKYYIDANSKNYIKDAIKLLSKKL